MRHATLYLFMSLLLYIPWLVGTSNDHYHADARVVCYVYLPLLVLVLLSTSIMDSTSVYSADQATFPSYSHHQRSTIVRFGVQKSPEGPEA